MDSRMDGTAARSPVIFKRPPPIRPVAGRLSPGTSAGSAGSPRGERLIYSKNDEGTRSRNASCHGPCQVQLLVHVQARPR